MRNMIKAALVISTLATSTIAFADAPKADKAADKAPKADAPKMDDKTAPAADKTPAKKDAKTPAKKDATAAKKDASPAPAPATK